MRYRCNVPDSGNVKAGTLQGTDGCLTAAARSLHIDLNLPQPVNHGLAGGVTSRHLGGVRGAFTGTLETGGSGTSPGNGIALGVGQRYYGIIKGRLYVSPAGGD